MDEINPGILGGKAYEMSFLVERYRMMLALNGMESSKSYRSEKLKKRLKNHYLDSITFHKQPDPSKPELIYSSSISVQSIINAAASFPRCDDHTESSKAEQDMEIEKLKVLYHAAQILKSDIKTCKGISIQPLSVSDISLDSGRRLLPDSLYSLLSWIVSDNDVDPKKGIAIPVCNNPDDHRRVLMLGQDMVHTAMHSRVKTPKHIGLAVTVHHLTGSKHIVTLLNKMGHCSSYDDVEVIITGLAREIKAKADEVAVIIPSNISRGVFVQFAADNNDLNEETLDGKQTTHATTIVAYQRQQFGPNAPQKVFADHSSKRRSLELPLPTQTIYECGVHGRRPTLKAFLGKVQEQDFRFPDDLQPSVETKDLVWFLLRLHQRVLLSCELNEDQQTTPSWSAFNAMISTLCMPCTNIGYCPMIAGSPTEYSTVYTILKTVQAMTKSLDQRHSVVTFDLAIYTKAKEIQWRHPEEFENLIVRMGGFHIALNFLSVIGKKFAESGIEDLLTESGVYGSNTTLALLKGKSYNPGVRAHKLIMEALLRLQWQAFCKWLAKEREDHRLEGVDMSQIETNLDKFKESSATGEKKKVFDVLCNSTQNLILLLSRFKSESCESSQLFKFWNSYVKMVLVLLRFIRAEREGDWRLHLASTAEMTPYFFSMDRTNYSRWLPVYIADMHLLEDTAPEVHQEFMQGNHAVSRSCQPFSQIWTDMALEQTVNLDSKTKGGIVGISQKPGALERWFLTAHKRTAITSATKELCGICNSDSRPPHKEAGLRRISRDEEEVKKLITTVLSVMSNPFDKSILNVLKVYLKYTEFLQGLTFK